MLGSRWKKVDKRRTTDGHAPGGFMLNGQPASDAYVRVTKTFERPTTNKADPVSQRVREQKINLPQDLLRTRLDGKMLADNKMSIYLDGDNEDSFALNPERGGYAINLIHSRRSTHGIHPDKRATSYTNQLRRVRGWGLEPGFYSWNIDDDGMVVCRREYTLAGHRIAVGR